MSPPSMPSLRCILVETKRPNSILVTVGTRDGCTGWGPCSNGRLALDSQQPEGRESILCGSRSKVPFDSNPTKTARTIPLGPSSNARVEHETLSPHFYPLHSGSNHHLPWRKFAPPRSCLGASIPAEDPRCGPVAVTDSSTGNVGICAPCARWDGICTPTPNAHRRRVCDDGGRFVASDTSERSKQEA